MNKWTIALAGAGVVGMGAVGRADEQPLSNVMTAVSPTTISGYVSASAAFWSGGQGSEAALPGRWNDGPQYQDGFNLDVVSVTLEKPLSDENWAAGYLIQGIAGPNAVGFNPSYMGDADSDFGLKQAYVNLRLPAGNGIEMKMGTFNAPIGYESFESYSTPNFGRSYGWNLEPTQLTGLSAAYKFDESVVLTAGVADTWVAGINNRNVNDSSMLAYFGALTLTAPESWGWMKGSQLTGAAITGYAGNSVQTWNTYVGLTVPTPIEGFSVGGAFDYRVNGVGAATTTDNYAWAGAGYLTFQADKWKFALRADYTQASSGTWYAPSPLTGGTGGQQQLGSLTLTVDYSLWANVISRVELRWDHSFSDANPYGGNDSYSGGEGDATTVLANVIYKF